MAVTQTITISKPGGVLFEDVISHLNIEYDKEALIKESKDPKYLRVNARDAYVSQFAERHEKWFLAPAKGPEALRIKKLLEEKLGCLVRVRFFIQGEDMNLDWHTDHVTLTSINFVLKGNKSPIEFESGRYHYECALLDVNKLHRVVKSDEDRLILKCTIRDKTYNECKECLESLIQN